MPYWSICVFCGARAGKSPAFTAQAEALGRLIASEGWRLVYGAGDVGLMGTVARSAQAAGGETFGVIPQHLVAWEVGKTDLTQFIVTENMHERKKVMFMNSDAIVVLPGGAGTLDEFFEVLTWRQLGLHKKPVFLLNTEGYWTPLLTMIDHVIEQGFADASLREFITVCEDDQALERALRAALA
jgi:uncharacterized protein (TIGR00730 family)